MAEQHDTPVQIGPYGFEDYLGLVKAFHGNVAPGLVIGGFMVDLAQRRLPAGVLFDAICETRNCLPDAVQLLTPVHHRQRLAQGHQPGAFCRQPVRQV